MKTLLLFSLAVLFSKVISAQSIGIGTANPATSAMLDVSAVDKGLLVPRVSTVERNAIVSPANGLLVYDITLNRFYFYNNAQWTDIASLSTNWSTLGNSAVGNSGALGTNDASNLYFKTNGVRSGSILWGAQASTTFGYLAAPNATATGTVAIGHLALSDLTTGGSNTAVGLNAVRSTATGAQNTGVGAFALILNTTGSRNTAIGYDALSSNKTSSYNTAIGSIALSNTTTGYNTAVGGLSLVVTTQSEYNTAVGYNSGANQNNGYNNVFLGANTGVNSPGLFNVIVIGQAASGTASSQVTIGNGATNSYRAYANWSNISDGRFKKNVSEDVQGLAFINALRPVTYNLDASAIDEFLHRGNSHATSQSAEAMAIHQRGLKEKETMRISGFVAQEVEQTARKLHFNFSGVDAPKNDNDFYGLRYAEFVVPLVKAVQEQQSIISQQKNEIETLKQQMTFLAQKIETMQK